MSNGLLLLATALLPRFAAMRSPSSEAGHGGGNASAELIFISLLLLGFWAAIRITKKRRS